MVTVYCWVLFSTRQFAYPIFENVDLSTTIDQLKRMFFNTCFPDSKNSENEIKYMLDHRIQFVLPGSNKHDYLCGYQKLSDFESRILTGNRINFSVRCTL